MTNPARWADITASLVSGCWLNPRMVAGRDEAVRLAAELGPEVIIMDVLMPERDGIDACREIMDLLPETRVLMLTASTAPQAVVESVAAGAAGYLLKDSGVEELAGAVREVAEGRFNLTAAVLRQAAVMIRRDLRVSRSAAPRS